jgi:hypothetical protein
MMKDCANYKNDLQEAALTGNVQGALQEHLKTCVHCTGEFAALQARRQQMDELLPLVARGAELPAGFTARVLSAAQATQSNAARPWRMWIMAGAAVAVALAALFASPLFQRRASVPLPQEEVAAAQKLAEWRAPSDVLLNTPDRELLRATPKLGESYLKVIGKNTGEE